MQALSIVIVAVCTAAVIGFVIRTFHRDRLYWRRVDDTRTSPRAVRQWTEDEL